MTDPREPNDLDSAVDGIDLDDARFEQRGTADVETGAGETGAAEGSSDTADLAIDDDAELAPGDEVADATPEIEGGDTDSLVTDPLTPAAADSDLPAEDEVAAEAEADEEKVVATPARRRRGRITADDDEDDDEPGSTRARRPASRPAARESTGTRSRAAAERARAESGQRRSLARFLREVVAELRKVIWPGRRELITYTTVVIVFVAFMVALVAGLDLLFAQGVIAVFG